MKRVWFKTPTIKTPTSKQRQIKTPTLKTPTLKKLKFIDTLIKQMKILSTQTQIADSKTNR